MLAFIQVILKKSLKLLIRKKKFFLNYLCNDISRKKYVSIINEFLLPSSILENEKFINFCRYLKNHHFFFLYSWPTSNMEYIQKITQQNVLSCFQERKCYSSLKKSRENKQLKKLEAKTKEKKIHSWKKSLLYIYLRPSLHTYFGWNVI